MSVNQDEVALNTERLPTYVIESLDLEGRGVSRGTDGKVVFIEGALPFETVKAQINVRKPKWDAGVCVKVLKESSERVTPQCPHFGLSRTDCGGCKMQHLSAQSQVAVKQRVLEDNLWHIARIRPLTVARAVHGPQFAYRYRARLSVRFVRAREQALVGFHERQSRYIADIQSCSVLPKHVSAMLMPLRTLISALNAREACPQIEVACGDETTALVLRHMEPLIQSDLQVLEDFAKLYNVQWWLQPGDEESVHLLDASTPSRLGYSLAAFGIRMPYRPSDFTQVNPYINEVLVARAIQNLHLLSGESVVDWFCGLGNFTLPLATIASQVQGVEGSTVLVERAKDNYEYNQRRRSECGGQPLGQVNFIARNLFEMTAEVLWADGTFDKWLVDPPREGCAALVSALAQLCKLECVKRPQAGGLDAQFWSPPKTIVYVSCNPSTLARDAQILVNEAGYICTSAGVVNMFAQTAHVESVAVFERAEQ